jgi:hypothetical protein
VSVAEEGTSDGVIETVDNLIIQIGGSRQGFVVSTATYIDVLDELDSLVVRLGIKKIVNERAEHAGCINLVGTNVGVNVEVVPHITIERDDNETFGRHGSIDTQATGNYHLRLSRSQPAIILPGSCGMLVVVFLLNLVRRVVWKDFVQVGESCESMWKGIMIAECLLALRIVELRHGNNSPQCWEYLDATHAIEELLVAFQLLGQHI